MSGGGLNILVNKGNDMEITDEGGFGDLNLFNKQNSGVGSFNLLADTEGNTNQSLINMD